VRRLLLFFVVAVVAVVALYVLFKLRYGWYTNDAQATFLNIGFLIALTAISVLWAGYPTRIGVAFLGIAVLAFPAILRPSEFVMLDAPFAVYAIIPVALLIGATHLRLRSKER
jgi:bacteriorhodopsin